MTKTLNNTSSFKNVNKIFIIILFTLIILALTRVSFLGGTFFDSFLFGLFFGYFRYFFYFWIFFLIFIKAFKIKFLDNYPLLGWFILYLIFFGSSWIYAVYFKNTTYIVSFQNVWESFRLTLTHSWENITDGSGKNYNDMPGGIFGVFLVSIFYAIPNFALGQAVFWIVTILIVLIIFQVCVFDYIRFIYGKIMKFFSNKKKSLKKLGYDENKTKILININNDETNNINNKKSYKDFFNEENFYTRKNENDNYKYKNENKFNNYRKEDKISVLKENVFFEQIPQNEYWVDKIIKFIPSISDMQKKYNFLKFNYLISHKYKISNFELYYHEKIDTYFKTLINEISNTLNEIAPIDLNINYNQTDFLYTFITVSNINPNSYQLFLKKTNDFLQEYFINNEEFKIVENISDHTNFNIKIFNKDHFNINFLSILNEVGYPTNNNLEYKYLIGQVSFEEALTCSIKKNYNLLIVSNNLAYIQNQINIIIDSLFLFNKISNLWLNIFDPEDKEYFKIYQNSPFLQNEIINSYSNFQIYLNSLLEESKKRLKLFRLFTSDSINDYNNKQKNKKLKLPFIILVINNFSPISLEKYELIWESLERINNNCGIYIIYLSNFTSGKFITITKI